MTRLTARALLLAGLGLAACSVAPPTDLLEDHELAALGLPLPAESRWKAPGMAIGPVALTYLRPQEAVFWDVAALTARPGGTSGADVAGDETPTARRPSRAELEEEVPYSWWKPPLDAAGLEKRLADVLSWALYSGRKPAPTIDAGGLARIDSASLCAAADKRRGQLLVHVDVIENRVSWVRRDIWWWADLALFWGGGVLPVAFVPDEVYEVAITARLTIVHARSGRALVQRKYSGLHRASLNHPQRGWNISGLLGLHPFFLTPDEGDYGRAYEALRPHAWKKLEHAIAAGLRRSLPEALDRPENRKLVQEGTEESARTYAIVVGHNGPKVVEPRPPLRFARNDAEALGAWLLESRTVQSEDHLHVLVNEDATRERIFARVNDLAPQLLGLDRLIFYYAGYGRTDANGSPVLVLGGSKSELTVADLARELERELVENGNNPRVVFLLDCSFGPETGRGRTYRSATHPGGPPPNRITYLDKLGNKALGWCALAAAGPGETAYEIVDAQTESARHGFFTACLLNALRGEADTRPRDGVVKTDELIAYLAEQVPEGVKPAEQAGQNPERRGTEEPIVVGIVRGASSPQGTRAAVEDAPPRNAEAK